MELEFSCGEISKVVWALDADTPAALFNFSPNSGPRIRSQLRMKDESRTKSNDALAPFFDPAATSEKRKRVIVIFDQVGFFYCLL